MNLVKNVIKLSLIITLISFFLHLIWEYAQCIPFFNHEKLQPTHQAMLMATLGDILLTYIAYIFVTTVKKDWLWPLKKWDFKILFGLIIVSLVLSISIELRALSTGRWSYSEINPLLLNKVSIIPILQLLILFPLTFYLSRLLFVKYTQSRHAN